MTTAAPFAIVPVGRRFWIGCCLDQYEKNSSWTCLRVKDRYEFAVPGNQIVDMADEHQDTRRDCLKKEIPGCSRRSHKRVGAIQLQSTERSEDVKS